MAKRWSELTKGEQENVKQGLASLGAPGTLPGKGTAPKNGFRLLGYVRCDLSATEREEFASWEAGRERTASLERLLTLVEDGYLLKASPNASGFQASLCAGSTNTPWDGYVLVAMARHASRACDVLVYKHDVLLRGDWSLALQDDTEGFLR